MQNDKKLHAGLGHADQRRQNVGRSNNDLNEVCSSVIDLDSAEEITCPPMEFIILLYIYLFEFYTRNNFKFLSCVRNKFKVLMDAI